MTVKEFNEMLKYDSSLKEAYGRWLTFEVWLAKQGAELQQEVDHKCREYIENLYGKENI